MGLSIDQALGVHPAALAHRVKRSEVIASNLANIDTPGYQAKDLEFATVLDSQQQVSSFRSDMKYRVPYQPSQDGNTVELSVEQANFAKNTMDFETSLTFFKMKTSGLMKAIEGN